MKYISVKLTKLFYIESFLKKNKTKNKNSRKNTDIPLDKTGKTDTHSSRCPASAAWSSYRSHDQAHVHRPLIMLSMHF